MNIQPDFSQNIIISAKGEWQIRLLYLIYSNINIKYNRIFSLEVPLICDENYKDFNKNLLSIVNNCKSENIQTELLYHPLTSSTSINTGTAYTRKKLEMIFKNEFVDFKNNSFINRIIKSRNVTIYDHRLVNMKEVLDIYGMYLFDNKKDHTCFINRYEEYFSEYNIFKAIKNMNYDWDCG